MTCLLCHQRYEPKLGWGDFLTVKQADVLCEMCRRSFSLIEGERCRQCDRPFSQIAESYRHGDICADCLRWQQTDEWRNVLTKNRSVYVYDEWMKDVVTRWKFRGDYALVEAFRTDVCREFFRHFSPDVVLVPIPLSKKRLYERGFNQAKALAELLSLPIADVLERVDSEKQSKKTRMERLQSNYLFRLCSNVLFPNVPIVLIDDIYTTGMTVRHAARILREAGVDPISSFTLARS